MTHTTETQPGEQVASRPASVGSRDAEQDVERPRARNGSESAAENGYHERTVLVGEADGGAVVREGAAEVSPPEDGAVGTVRIPATATPAEADAIVAAVREQLLAAGCRPADDGDETPPRWVAAGRLRDHGRIPATVLDEGGSDPWVAASRGSTRR